MNKKITIQIFAVLFSITALLRGQTTGNQLADVILSGYSVRMFSSEPVSDNDIELILKCGIKAPSGRNQQPWWFTVVKDKALLKELMPNITDGNILIIISGKEGSNVDFDCGLATQNMFIAAQSLGLGARIYGGPANFINTSKREIFGIPQGYRAIVILRIGHIDKSVDAVSAASSRKKIEEVVNFK